MISDDGIKFYDENGYYVVENVLTSEQCDELQKSAEALADQNYSVVLNIHRRLPEFEQIMKGDAVVSIIKAVQRSPVCGLNSQFLFKRCNTAYAKQSWTPHQDNSYPRCPKNTYIIAHLSLEDSDPENGGLVFYPKSHNEDILDYVDNKSWKEDFDKQGFSHPGQTIIKIPDQYVAMDMYLKKGSLCLMHGNLIHESHPNLSPTRSRPQFSMAYVNKGVTAFNQGKNSIKELMEIA